LRLLKAQDRRFGRGVAGAEDEKRWRSAAFSDWDKVEKALNFRDVGG
jgi:hypothetical protein